MGTVWPLQNQQFANPDLRQAQYYQIQNLFPNSATDARRKETHTNPTAFCLAQFQLQLPNKKILILELEDLI